MLVREASGDRVIAATLRSFDDGDIAAEECVVKKRNDIYIDVIPSLGLKTTLFSVSVRARLPSGDAVLRATCNSSYLRFHSLASCLMVLMSSVRGSLTSF